MIGTEPGRRPQREPGRDQPAKQRPR
jgi:hypothetical protein